MAAFIALTIVGCASQQPEEYALSQEDLDYLECRAAQGPAYPEGREVQFCGRNLNDDTIANACTWAGKTSATASERKFFVRSSNCTFSNENKSRARCSFEYITTTWADFHAQGEPEGQWHDSSVNLTFFKSLTDDGRGHLGQRFDWIPDFSCPEKTN